METILIMLSGGIDSTFVLYHYLTETRLPVHVHHISLRYPQFERWKLEDPATQKIVAYCLKNYREFTYSESRFDLPAVNLVGSDVAIQMLAASKVGFNLQSEKVTLALGHCSDDFDSPEAQERIRLRTLPRLWEALLETGDVYHRLNKEFVRPLVDMQLTKEDVCRRLPDELMALCWSCRMPEFIAGIGRPCGRCHTCVKIETVFKSMGKYDGDLFPNLIRKPKSDLPIVGFSPGFSGAVRARGTAIPSPPPGMGPNRAGTPIAPIHAIRRPSPLTVNPKPVGVPAKKVSTSSN